MATRSDPWLHNHEPVVKHLRARGAADGAAYLERLLKAHLLPADVLGALADTEHWLGWTRHFGPVSGFEAKLEHPRERYVAAVFCCGCGLGPSQAARSLKGLDRRHVAHVNQRHMTEASLDDAITGVIDAYARIGLHRHWGTGESASADGMNWDVHPESLKSSYHLRYGGYGGIGYYLVSDTYIALFSRFLACGAYEGHAILDFVAENRSLLQPTTVHSDTQGQSAAIFGLAHLLGIELMPRIRSWQDLHLFRPDTTTRNGRNSDIALPMRALVLTASVPPVPERDVEGYYKRLKLLIGAVGQFADTVETVHIVPEHTVRSYPDPGALNAEQSRYWGFPVAATLLTTQEREKNFLNYYVRGMLSAAEQPAFQGALGPQQAGCLTEILDRGHDLVFVHRLAAMCALLRTGRRCRNTVFDLDDVEHQMKLRGLLQPPVRPGKLLSLSHIPALVAAEWRGAARSRLTFVCSDVDRRKLRRLGFSRNVTVVPNAVDIPQESAALAREPTLMFVGDYGYAPNREAAERLALHILPVVRQAVPGTRLLLAGKRSDRLDPAAATQPGVERLGFIESLAQLYGRARVVCCPLLNGGGTRVKLIEGAAHGKPMVSTRVGAEGLTFADGTEILLRDDDAGFAEACVRLIHDDELCRTLGGAARAKAIQDYRIDRIQEQVVRLLRNTAA